MKKFALILMNNPSEVLTKELPYILERGVDGIELSIEPGPSYVENSIGLKGVFPGKILAGHTRDDLPIASRNRELRRESIEELSRALNVFSELGVNLVTIHPHRGDPGTEISELIDLNVESLHKLADRASSLGVNITLENQPPFETAELMHTVLSKLERKVGMTFDLAHAHCYGDVNNFEQFLVLNASYIQHVHLSDNRGKKDEHLFSRYGTFAFEKNIPLLAKATKYKFLRYSSESFRILHAGEGKSVSLQDRPRYVDESVKYLSEILSWSYA